MRDEPTGVTVGDLVTALRAGWGIDARKISYLPVGAGGYHWSADDEWFLTVTGDEPGPLERALRTAAALPPGLAVTARPAVTGSPLWPLPSPSPTTRPAAAGRHLSVFPLLPGPAGEFGPHPPGRAPIVDLIVALHRATPLVAAVAPPRDLSLPGRDLLTSAAGGSRWTAGPYSAAAQDLLTTGASRIRRWLADLDALAVRIPATTVITHGEPHPGNILRTPTGPRLIDWDTVRLAPPERDLWFLATDPFAAPLSPDDEALARYARATGHRVSPAALAFYQLRWTLADLVAYAGALRRPHTDGPDAVAALGHLRDYLTA